jgi:phosphomannomutase
MKFCDKRGLFLRAEQVQRIEALLQNDTTYDWKDHDSLGQSSHREDTAALHVDHILSHIDADAIRKMGFRVVIDPCGSAGCSVDRIFLETLGCRVYGIHDHITDHFPRPPEPVPENLSLLGDEVRSRQAHIGFAQDPDADRLAVVSEQGSPIGEEYTVVLSGEAYLRRKKTNMAVNLSTSMMIDDLAARYNCTVTRTKIGEINVTDTLIESGFDFGGEGNGGTIIPSINPCRDSLLAMGLILELMATEKRALSHILLDFPSYCMKKNKITLDRPTPQDFYKKMRILSRDAFQGYAFNQEDGIKIYNNEEWLHIRSSNTEPVVRIMAESPSNERSDELIEMGNRLVISV